jgi:MerR family transcriptional regulator, thiopeptide resistance regulator
MRTVGDVAQLAGVTVKALHHYDEIGLLRPCGRSDAGYRLYSHEDLLRLQEILVWRQLGFPLAEIHGLMDAPSYARGHALRRQRALLSARADRIGATLRAVTRALEAFEADAWLEETQMFEGFDPRVYEDEAAQRWGDTAAHRDAKRRTAGYDRAAWSSIREEADVIAADFAALQRAGVDAQAEEARAVAERHRQHISRWFYDCPVEIHAGLGAMYTDDARFRSYWDSRGGGLAQFVRAAIEANTAPQPLHG